MTEVRFYHLERQSQMQVVPLLLSKALERGHRIILKMANMTQVAQMNDHLWTFDAQAFLPHGAEQNGDSSKQPVYLTDGDENPNEADVLILCAGAESEAIGGFTLCCEMLDGHDQGAVSAARARWKVYKDKGYEVTYWQQNERGGWDKKA